MDNTIFKKLKIKPEMVAALLYIPPEYPKYDNLADESNNKSDFVHLFITSKAEFEQRFSKAANNVTDDGLFWVSYPKSKGKVQYDINRDSLWDLVLAKGWHPVSQISLNDEWSAVRLKPNDPNKIYERPANIKR